MEYGNIPYEGSVNNNYNNINTRSYDEMTTGERELLSRLMSILYTTPNQLEFVRNNNEDIQTSPIERHSFHTIPQTRSPRRNTLRRSINRNQVIEPLRAYRTPKFNLSEKLRSFERKNILLQRTLEQMCNFFNEAYDIDVANACTKLAMNLRGISGYLHQHIERLTQADTGPPHEVYINNLASAFASFAHSNQLLTRILWERELLTTGDVDEELFSTLTKLAESESQYLKDNKTNRRMSGIRFRQHTFEMIVQLTRLIDDSHTCLSRMIRINRERRVKRWEGDYNRAMHMITFLTVFSVLLAIMLSIATFQNSGSLKSAAEGFWLVILFFTVTAMFANVAESLIKKFILDNRSAHRLRDMQSMLQVSQWFTMSADALFLTVIFLSFVGLLLETHLLPQATVSKVIVTTIAILQFLVLLFISLWFCFMHISPPKDTWSRVKDWAQVSIRRDSVGSQRRPSLENMDIEQGKVVEPVSKTEAPPIIQVTGCDDDPTSPLQEANAYIREVVKDPAKGSHEGSNSSHAVQSITSHGTNLDIPSVLHPSSEEGHSLPPLPMDVQVVRSLAYSPNGCFLCVGNNHPKENCSVISTDSPDVSLGAAKLSDIVQQIEWSPDSERVLLRMSHSTFVWNVLPSTTKKRSGFLVHQEADIVKWHPQKNVFFTCKGSVITEFDARGVPEKVYEIPDIYIQDFIIAHDGSRAICLTVQETYPRPGKSIPSRQRLILYNLDQNIIEQTEKIGRDVASIKSSTVSPNHLIVNFSVFAPPHIWRYEKPDDTLQRRPSPEGLFPERILDFRTKTGEKLSGERLTGCGIFGTSTDELVLTISEDGDTYIFATDSGNLLQHTHNIKGREIYSEWKDKPTSSSRTFTGSVIPAAVWDPDSVAFSICMGFIDGSIRQWKCSISNLSKDLFSAVILKEEDTTIIRQGERNSEPTLN